MYPKERISYVKGHDNNIRVFNLFTSQYFCTLYFDENNQHDVSNLFWTLEILYKLQIDNISMILFLNR